MGDELKNENKRTTILSYGDSPVVSGEHQKILAVDDSDLVRNAIRIELTRAGYQVTTAASGVDALEKLAEIPDLILLDFHMPEMDGIETLKKIRENPITKNIPVIMLTAMSELDTRIEAFNAGADDYIIKPYHKGELLIRVKRLIESNSLVKRLEREIEDRQKSQKVLREIEEKFNSLYDSSSDCLFIHDFEGKLIDANPATLKLLGYEKSDINKLKFRNILDEEEIKLAVGRIAGIMDKGTLMKPVELKVKHKNGSCIYVETTGYLIYSDGKPFAIQGVARDITKRKEAEAALMESQERYRKLAELSPDMIYILDRSGALSYVNWKAASCFNTTPEEMIGKKQEDLFPADIANDHLQGIKRVFETGKVLSIDECVELPNGKVWLEVTAIPLTNEKGEVVSMMAVSRDITERKINERFLTLRRDIAVGLGVAVDLKQALSQVLELIIETEEIGLDCGGVYLTDEVSGGLELITSRGLSEKFIKSSSFFDSDSPQTRLVKEGKTVCQDYSNIFVDHRLQAGKLEGLKYLIIIPVKHKGQAVAAINLASHKSVEILANTLVLLEGIATIAGGAITRFKAEKKEIELRERFKRIVEQMPFPISVCATDGTIQIVNSAFLKMIEVDSEDSIVGKENIYYNPYTSELGLIEEVKKVLNGETVYLSEISMPCLMQEQTPQPSKKESRIYEITIFPVLDKSKGIHQIVTVFEDISGRKRIENALRDSEMKFSQLFHLSPVAMTLLKMSDSKISDINETWLAQTGYDWDESIGKSVTEIGLISEQTRLDVVAELNKKGRVKNYAIEINTKDGKVLNALWSGQIVDFGGEPHLLSAAIDVTDRKRIENELKNAAMEWRATFDAMPDMVMLLDVDQNIIRVNKATKDNIGIPFHDILGKKCFRYIHNDNAPRPNCIHLRTLKDGKPHTSELRMDNLNREFLCTTSPIYNSNQELEGAVHVMHDITEQKRAEAEMLKVEKLESVGILAGGIAHDFNNILTSLWGNVQIALMNLKPSDENYELLIESDKACRRAKDLTQQLLTFSRGGAPVKKGTSIVQLIKESANFTLRGSNVKCDYDFAENLWPANIDTGQISQVIHNLVLNASQAMPTGGIIKIPVSNIVLDLDNIPGGAALKEGKYIKISVEDQGIGMKEEHLQKIFDPYFTTKQEGSGLGLSTSYSIVKRHDGYMTVRSEAGKGTTFDIYLPAAEEISHPEMDEEIELKKGTGKILVMDDEEQVRYLLGTLLKRLGYEVGLAPDGAAAVEMYSNAMKASMPYDAVVLDLTVPGGMGGKETMAKLIELDPNVKAIVSSGYSVDSLMADFKGYGFKGVINKPYKVKDLGDELARIIRG